VSYSGELFIVIVNKGETTILGTCAKFKGFMVIFSRENTIVVAFL
jgi:hypothetical protein